MHPANRSHLIDLECENSELKLLVDQFIKRIKDLESESFQNKVLGAGISLEQAFDIAATSGYFFSFDVLLYYEVCMLKLFISFQTALIGIVQQLET